MSGFTYHGKPVSLLDAADILRHRNSYWRYKLNVKRARDAQRSGLWCQLCSMIRLRVLRRSTIVR